MDWMERRLHPRQSAVPSLTITPTTEEDAAPAAAPAHPFRRFSFAGLRRLSLSSLHRSDSMVSLSHRALVAYIAEDDLQGLQGFLENKRVLVDDRDENGTTALHFAASKGKLIFVRELLSHGADANAEDNDGWTGLLCAAKEGHLEVCLELLDREADIEHRDMGGWTGLMWASYKGHTGVALMLLERGADVNAHGNYHISSLLWAAGRGHAEIAKALVAHAAKVNVGDKYGTTALVWASRKGNAEVVDCLLKAGAHVDTAGMYSWTPLLVATMGNHVAVASLLLECRPNVNAVDKDGCTALTIASKEGFTEIATALLNSGSYINIQDRSGDTNLIHAVKGGHRSVVEALLKKYADVDIPGKERKTATYNAVEKGNIPILKMLLTANPDLEVATKDGDTALLRAVRSRNTEAVHLLLERKAKVSASDRWGDTALHIAMRARSKAIVEVLLRNPKNSQLLYRPNRAGETPYNIDMNHPKTILGQIFGARRLNTNEDNENLLGYDLYSSALADMLSEPSLSMPITVGLYAKWGSGKSFLLNKLREEMQNFARQWVEPVVEFSWLLLVLLLHVAVVAGLAVGLASASWLVGLSTAGAVFTTAYALLLLIWYGSQRYNWELVYNLSVALTNKMNAIRVILQVIFCHPPGAQWSDNITAQPIRFYFTDQTRVSSTAGGENSVVQMIGSLYDSIEADYGTLATRLYRAFRPKSLKSTSSWRWRRLCCLPDIVMLEICFVCFLVLISVLVIYLVELHLPESEVSVERFSAKILFGVCSGVVLLAVVANLYSLGRVFSSLVFSQRRQLRRAIARMETVRSEGFLQALRSEVNLMRDMVKCLDAFSQQQTRLVVIVDGLDSCEQDKVLLVLDAVHVLFSDTNSPFIIILAIDPHIISKAVESNSRRLFSESNIGGHDYLRNMVHLPFYLQNSGLRKLKMAQKSATKKASIAQTYDTFAESAMVRSSSARRLSNAEGLLSRSQEKLKQGGGGGARGSTGGGSGSAKRLRPSESIASSLASNLNRAGGAHDLTRTLLTDDYFSDVNPRSMRRLMNVVYITGRLLKAFQIDFNWYHLASWINITEQWPYRTSWLILYHDSAEESFDDSTSLKTLYDKVRMHIPMSKEVEPLLELDRDERKLDIFLTFHRSNLLVGDLRVFLPFTINLDPYIKKVIKEEQQNVDDSVLTGLTSVSQMQQVATPAGWPQSPTEAWSVYKRTPKGQKGGLGQRLGRQQSGGGSGSGGGGGGGQFSAGQGQTMQHHLGGPTSWGQPPPQPLYHAPPSPPPLPSELDEVQLDSLSVSGVCELISKLNDLQPSQMSALVSLVQSNNISGKVLMHCDLAELKQVLKMSFGDWEIFRMALMRLRCGGLSGGVRRRRETPQGPKNVHFEQPKPATNQTSSSQTEKERPPMSKQSVMEKQVTLEEQMICGALQTLNEEACEDVMEESKDPVAQDQGDLLNFDHLSRVGSENSCYSNAATEETDMILLQCLPSQPTQWVPTSGGESPAGSLCDTPVFVRRRHDDPTSVGERPSSLLTSVVSHDGSRHSLGRSHSVEDDALHSHHVRQSCSVLSGLTASLLRRGDSGCRGGEEDDESTPLVSDASTPPSPPSPAAAPRSLAASSEESLSALLEGGGGGGGGGAQALSRRGLRRQGRLLSWDDPETTV